MKPVYGKNKLTFGNTKPGTQFVVVIARTRFFFQHLVEEIPMQGHKCDCGGTTWNAVNESNNRVHFCANAEIESVIRW